MSIAWLRERMEQWADHPAIVWNDHPFLYRDLLARLQMWHQALDRHDVGTGQVVTIEGDYSPNAVSLLLALIERNTIVVPLTRSVAAQREEFLDIAEVQVVVSFDDDDRWRIERRARPVTNPLTCQLIERGHPGLVLFSSGSTGKSKAALHDFIPLLEKFQVPRHRRVTLTFLLLDHIGGINTLFYTLANGGTVVAVPSRDPDVVCRAIETHRAQTLPTSPTFLNLLLISEAYKRYDLSSLELITYGTEVMPESTLQRIHALFPNVQLLQTYGLSELGILRSKSRDSSSLWVKIGGEGFETKIVDGVLWIRARSAMLGYLNAPSPFDEEGWMNTQDVVEVDGEYIRILGRRSEIINVGGQKVYPAEVESVLLQMPNVKDVAVTGESNPITGQIVTARFNLFEPEDPNEFKRRVRAFCRERLAPYKIPVKIIITDDKQHSARFKKMRRSSP
ncbi:long-chain fatty acid--CoA ligase [Chloroflexus sp.]|uniref:long-chain fatty acid--CoA ligase n=1 Tax=Chloroflexus sp. TaxID=1904827 RepID=UPI002619E3CC|nr:long-chain fatty acid--CoA ligase [uncultured Chloroflexus sp.]